MNKYIYKIILILFLTISTITTASTIVTLETSKGDIVLELNEKKAPITVNNFLKYVEEGFYDGVIFHRVIPHFMIQAGGYTQDLNVKVPHMPILNESMNGLSNKKGSISMARTNNPHSATSQFFINVTNNNNLDAIAGIHGYTVFGRVIEGLSVVMRISKQRTSYKRSMGDVPLNNIVINKAYIGIKEISDKTTASTITIK